MSSKPMSVGSLFAGIIGGFDLGFERAGFDIRWQVEIDPWARAVLAKHWPHVHRHDDVRTAGAHNLEAVDVICGGFPCQDISLAGKGAGIADGTRSGLWSEYARIVREIAAVRRARGLRPPYVVVENVAALLARGLGRVLGDLAACGYDAEWDCIPAAAVGAPHRRDRLWLVAYPNGSRWEAQRESRAVVAGRQRGLGLNDGCADVADAVHDGREERPVSEGERRQAVPDASRRSRSGAHVADTDQSRLEGWQCGGVSQRAIERTPWSGGPRIFTERPTGQWEPEPAIRRVVDGLPKWVDGLNLDECLRAIMAYARSADIRPSEAVRMVRKAYGEAEVFQWKTGGSNHVCAPQVLLPVLRRIEAVCKEELDAQAGQEAQGHALRGVRDDEATPSAPSRSGFQEQRAEQHSDAVQVLSRLLAQHCASAWEKDRGSYAADRVSRLRGLGNAIVPQIAEFIAGRIAEAEARRAVA